MAKKKWREGRERERERKEKKKRGKGAERVNNVALGFFFLRKKGVLQ